MSVKSSSDVSFSVCIPNFNYGRYIGATIESVLSQTYPHYELVVVDNHSTDDSVRVINSFKSERLRLYVNPYNVGFGPNLDRAARWAEYPYLIMLSADDLMRPTALEDYAAVIRRLGPDSANVLIASNIEYFNDAGDILHTTSRSELFEIGPDDHRTAALAQPDVAVFNGLQVFAKVFPRMKVATPFCATAYSRQLYERVGGYSSLHHTAPDANFAYKAMLGGADVVFVDRPLFGYRIHSSNQLQSDRRQKTLKVPIDHYAFSLQFSDADLARAGVSRNDAVKALVDETCLNGALLEVRGGDSRQAFRLLMFGLAASPFQTLRNPKTLLLTFLMLPLIGRPMSRVLYNIRRLWKRTADAR